MAMDIEEKHSTNTPEGTDENENEEKELDVNVDNKNEDDENKDDETSTDHATPEKNGSPGNGETTDHATPVKNGSPGIGEIPARRPLHSPEKKTTVPTRRPIRPPGKKTTVLEECVTKIWRSISCHWVLWLSFFSILCSPVYMIYSRSNKPENDFKNDINIDLVNLISEKYPEQNLQLFKLFSRLIKIANNSTRKQDLSFVFTILHNSTHKTTTSIADYLAYYAAQEFNKKNKVHKIYGSKLPADFGSKDHVTNMRNVLNNNGAMIVYDLEQTPSYQARKFHAICDKYTPFVETKLAYILVLETDKLNHVQDLDNTELCEMAKSTLKELWSDLEKPVLESLIVRLTENIVQIKS